MRLSITVPASPQRLTRLLQTDQTFSAHSKGTIFIPGKCMFPKGNCFPSKLKHLYRLDRRFLRRPRVQRRRRRADGPARAQAAGSSRAAAGSAHRGAGTRVPGARREAVTAAEGAERRLRQLGAGRLQGRSRLWRLRSRTAV